VLIEILVDHIFGAQFYTQNMVLLHLVICFSFLLRIQLFLVICLGFYLVEGEKELISILSFMQ
jgi:hypothetical protein